MSRRTKDAISKTKDRLANMVVKTPHYRQGTPVRPPLRAK